MGLKYEEHNSIFIVSGITLETFEIYKSKFQNHFSDEDFKTTELLLKNNNECELIGSVGIEGNIIQNLLWNQ